MANNLNGFGLGKGCFKRLYTAEDYLESSSILQDDSDCKDSSIKKCNKRCYDEIQLMKYRCKIKKLKQKKKKLGVKIKISDLNSKMDMIVSKLDNIISQISGRGLLDF